MELPDFGNKFVSHDLRIGNWTFEACRKWQAARLRQVIMLAGVWAITNANTQKTRAKVGDQLYHGRKITTESGNGWLCGSSWIPRTLQCIELNAIQRSILKCPKARIQCDPSKWLKVRTTQSFTIHESRRRRTFWICLSELVGKTTGRHHPYWTTPVGRPQPFLPKETSGMSLRRMGW